MAAGSNDAFLASSFRVKFHSIHTGGGGAPRKPRVLARAVSDNDGERAPRPLLPTGHHVRVRFAEALTAAHDAYH